MAILRFFMCILIDVHFVAFEFYFLGSYNNFHPSSWWWFN
jgi:hypothetical protein